MNFNITSNCTANSKRSSFCCQRMDCPVEEFGVFVKGSLVPNNHTSPKIIMLVYVLATTFKGLY